MSDPRLTPMNTRVADARLHDVPDGVARVEGTARQVGVPVIDLLRAPEGTRERQLLYGDTLRVFEDRDGWAYVQADKDGYVGYLPSSALVPVAQATHWVSAPATHAYVRPDMKSPEAASLSFASRLEVAEITNGFAKTPLGYMPTVHLSEIDTLMSDPATVAAGFLGTPYLWGGNSRFGIDCSGLVQAGLLACGIACPGDSDLQQQRLGRALPKGTVPERGDLLFWKGHVAWVADPETILHANAGHMAVTYEPLQAALARIQAQGGGPVTAHKRL
ncbi:C40 family peptidase [Ruegeria sp. 2012CJ41-6]|uniref:C40 family peptidase n=1 Tax=Ruegeria spongiae TaxID=2942209 RepID=A0ABT0PYS2_9RHOB|nr:NlpC/P60 family protein [Ruegeria spongiae]MCL6282775.1 C40 family peptidase [Ruegeria spongiae]